MEYHFSAGRRLHLKFLGIMFMIDSWMEQEMNGQIGASISVTRVLEKVVYNQSLPFLETIGITEPFQSGFKALHSIESVL